MIILLIIAICVFGYMCYVLIKPENFNAMNSELIGVISMYGIAIILAILLGKYIGKIFNYEKLGWINCLIHLINCFQTQWH
ncbi:MAG: potassium-transporting ATPase subunit F [Bacteroidetes bacterium]|nr:potassium-transporting ATPase subunit F [Bacteroidota bacterium]